MASENKIQFNRGNSRQTTTRYTHPIHVPGGHYARVARLQKLRPKNR